MAVDDERRAVLREVLEACRAKQDPYDKGDYAAGWDAGIEACIAVIEGMLDE